MAKVFISFLGIGNPNAKENQPGYDVLTYRFDGDDQVYKSMFAQRAIIEKHGATTFDRICLMMTPESKAKHRDLLVEELKSVGCREEQIIEDDSITTNQNLEQQWEWFDSLQKLINDRDEVIFDFTHGFRSVPIIFSTAISFLQKVKQFKLLNAHYGYMTDKAAGKGEIIDMAKFYRINEWADGVSRLVDMADTSKLASLAEDGMDDGFAALNDPQLILALRNLTSLIRNIDVNHIAAQADQALKLVAQKQTQCSGADAQLLQMVVDKFTSLAVESSDHYDYNYFKLQLILTEMLLKHEMHMQAFTVMRECIASIGMLGAKGKYAKEKRHTNDGRRYRKNLGEQFAGMCITERAQWRQEDESKRKTITKPDIQYFDEMLKPFYDSLESLGIANPLHRLAKEIGEYRNGFDHAWISKPRAANREEIIQRGKKCLSELTKIIEELGENKLIPIV